ncbi:MAG: DUF455 family protein [Planctomycetes bacterium]|nr:DUF455 family protein [Planctomycetota bacterium]
MFANALEPDDGRVGSHSAPASHRSEAESSIGAVARRVLLATDVAVKIGAVPSPETLEDDRATLDPVPLGPGRPTDLRIVPGSRVKVPPANGIRDPLQRVRLLHALANHELQAAELFAWALLSFPDAPADYRRGLLGILDDECRHTRMYIARLEALGGRFGEYPVSGYFWNKAPELTTPLRFICAMSLTFENANLDHTVDYAEAARSVDDEKTAALIDRVHDDEVEHVRFGWTWLSRLKRPEETMWQAYCANLAFPLQPNRAIGRRFHVEGRKAVGMDRAFIAELERFTTHGRFPRWD